jgi:radical SAM-linked protein
VARQPQGPAPARAVQRLRVRYAKRGRLRFCSHRDFQRALERALRRAGVPVAFSAGFTPHPKVSYAGAAPTGVASEAEYLELAVTERQDPGQLRAVLDASLPPGLDLLEVVEAAGGSLPDRLEASVWELRLPGVAPGTARTALSAFLATERVEVERLTANGVRIVDVRGVVVRLEPAPDTDPQPTGDSPPCAILRLVVRHATPSVRPDDVLTGLRSVADLAPLAPVAVTRLAQGPLNPSTGTVADPLAPDRDAVGAQGATAAQP